MEGGIGKKIEVKNGKSRIIDNDKNTALFWLKASRRSLETETKNKWQCSRRNIGNSTLAPSNWHMNESTFYLISKTVITSF